LKYEGCKLITEPAKKCIVAVNSETAELEGTLETETTLGIKPKTGTSWLTIGYTNNGAETCPAPFLGGCKLTGAQTFEIIKPGTAETTKAIKAIGHTLKCFSAEVELSQELTMTFTGLGDSVYVSKEA
jgi:hypothetical protein